MVLLATAKKPASFVHEHPSDHTTGVYETDLGSTNALK